MIPLDQFGNSIMLSYGHHSGKTKLIYCVRKYYPVFSNTWSQSLPFVAMSMAASILHSYCLSHCCNHLSVDSGDLVNLFAVLAIL